MDAKIEILHALQAMTKELGRVPKRDEFTNAYFTRDYIEKHYGTWSVLLQAAGLGGQPGRRVVIDELPKLERPPKVLWLDIETSLMSVETFGIRDQYIEHDSVIKDWFVMSFCAMTETETHYLDQRYSNPVSDDSMLLIAVHHLLQNSDIVYTWNGEHFDFKKLNARFVKHGLNPVLSFRSIDGYKIARSKFGFTSNKLDYVAKYLGIEGKLTGRKFPGKKLWRECENGNMEAWDEMERYNRQDVVILKEVMAKLDPWHNKVNFGVYEQKNKCSCGSTSFSEGPVKVTNSGKFERFVCSVCGKEFIGKRNLLHPDTRKELLK